METVENIENIEYYQCIDFPDIIYSVDHKDRIAKNIRRNMTVNYDFFALLTSSNSIYAKISREEVFLCLI